MTTGCTVGGKSSTVTTYKLGPLNSSGSTGTIGVSFTLDLGAFQCPYSGTDPFSFTAETSSIQVSGGLTSPAELCNPEEGEVTFKGGHTLETRFIDGGGNVDVD